MEFSCHWLQAARGLLSESNKASPCCSVVCLMLFCESNHVLWSSVSICFLDPRSIWWYGVYLLKQQATQFRNESISNYSQIILGVSLQKEVNNELKQYFIPNSLYVISTSASQIGSTKAWPSVGTNDSQLFSLPSNLKKGYSEEWKIVISIHW